MKNTEDYISEFIKELSKADHLDLNQFPDMELYMEQVLGFADTKLNHLKRSDNDKVYTSSIINNYTKAGILMTPNKRKYGKDHLVLLIMVYYLKQTLSVKDIHDLFSPILKDMSTSEDDVISLQDIYTTFLDVKQEEYDRFQDDILHKFGAIETKVNAFDLDEDEQKTAQLFITVITLLAQANAKKLLAEKIIDNYFKDISEES